MSWVSEYARFPIRGKAVGTVVQTQIHSGWLREDSPGRAKPTSEIHGRSTGGRGETVARRSHGFWVSTTTVIAAMWVGMSLTMTHWVHSRWSSSLTRQ